MIPTFVANFNRTNPIELENDKSAPSMMQARIKKSISNDSLASRTLEFNEKPRSVSSRGVVTLIRNAYTVSLKISFHSCELICGAITRN